MFEHRCTVFLRLMFPFMVSRCFFSLLLILFPCLGFTLSLLSADTLPQLEPAVCTVMRLKILALMRQWVDKQAHDWADLPAMCARYVEWLTMIVVPLQPKVVRFLFPLLSSCSPDPSRCGTRTIFLLSSCAHWCAPNGCLHSLCNVSTICAVA